uniref:Uncharacterized protein n=1 Tax=Aegilops tauschii TaxID=37682 RepID=N1R4E6_AEGTA
MAEMVKSAIVAEAVNRIISGIAPTSKIEDKTYGGSSGDGGIERLEMARIKMEAALQTSNKWQITDTSIFHWRKKVKHFAQDCDDEARRCRQLFREEDEAEQAARKSSFPRRVAHTTKTFISSFIRRGNDHCSAGRVTAAAVRRFERLADDASEFMRYVQLGGTPRHHLFFDPLIGHIFAGKTLTYQVLHPGGQYHFLRIRSVGFNDRGLEATITYIYEDRKVPKNNFTLGVMMRLSESTDIIGTTVKCLRLVTPHFKCTADVVIREITHLPTQDFSYFAHVQHCDHIHRTLTEWFRPDPLCCQGYDHDVVPSSHGGSNCNNGGGNKFRFSSIFPESVCQVFLLRPMSLSEYLSGSTIVTGHDDTSSLENFVPLKLGILLLPHDSLEDPKSPCPATEVIDGEKQPLTHVNVHPDQLDKILLPKAIDYLHHNDEAMTYQVCWRSNHGSAHLCVEKTSSERTSGARRATRQVEHMKVDSLVTSCEGHDSPLSCEQLEMYISIMSVVSEVDDVVATNMLAKVAADEEGVALDIAATHSPETIRQVLHVSDDVHVDDDIVVAGVPEPNLEDLFTIKLVKYLSNLNALEA